MQSTVSIECVMKVRVVAHNYYYTLRMKKYQTSAFANEKTYPAIMDDWGSKCLLGIAIDRLKRFLTRGI